MKDGKLHVQAAAGIVADSDPQSEWQETQHKARALLQRRPKLARRRERAMILMIDNYDSFTYNLVQYLGELGAEVQVVRNDEIDRGRRSRRSQPAQHRASRPGPARRTRPASRSR